MGTETPTQLGLSLSHHSSNGQARGSRRETRGDGPPAGQYPLAASFNPPTSL